MCAGVVGPLLPFVDQVVVTAANLPRATDPAVLAAQITALGRARLTVEIVADPARAVARALVFPAPVLLTGSIYLVGPLRAGARRQRLRGRVIFFASRRAATA